MNINVKKIIFGDARNRRSPALLAVTPPRTRRADPFGRGEPAPVHRRPRTLLPGTGRRRRRRHPDGPLLDRQVVQGQLAAHYPQARIREIPPGDDPLRLDPGEQAWGLTLRSGGPEFVPLRTFRDDDLLDAGSDPLIALLGALGDLRPGERLVSACCCAPSVPTGPRPTSRRLSRTPASSGPIPPTPTRPSPCNWTASPWPCWARGRWLL